MSFQSWKKEGLVDWLQDCDGTMSRSELLAYAELKGLEPDDRDSRDAILAQLVEYDKDHTEFPEVVALSLQE